MDNNDALDAGESSQTSEVVDLIFLWLELSTKWMVICHQVFAYIFFGRMFDMIYSKLINYSLYLVVDDV